MLQFAIWFILKWNLRSCDINCFLFVFARINSVLDAYLFITDTIIQVATLDNKVNYITDRWLYHLQKMLMPHCSSPDVVERDESSYGRDVFEIFFCSKMYPYF